MEAEVLRETAENATFLARAKWPWAEPVMRALMKANPKMDAGSFATGLNAWDRIEEWEAAELAQELSYNLAKKAYKL